MLRLKEFQVLKDIMVKLLEGQGIAWKEILITTLQEVLRGTMIIMIIDKDLEAFFLRILKQEGKKKISKLIQIATTIGSEKKYIC